MPNNVRIEPLATHVEFTNDSLHVILADGREVSAPLEWFPRLLSATPEQRRHWEPIGDGVGVRWPDVNEDVETESLLAIS
jgi:hypothetical protein